MPNAPDPTGNPFPPSPQIPTVEEQVNVYADEKPEEPKEPSEPQPDDL